MCVAANQAAADGHRPTSNCMLDTGTHSVTAKATHTHKLSAHPVFHHTQSIEEFPAQHPHPFLRPHPLPQGTLSTAGLQEVTAAHTQLTAYTSALQDELNARRAALTALAAETARQVGVGVGVGVGGACGGVGGGGGRVDEGGVGGRGELPCACEFWGWECGYVQGMIQQSCRVQSARRASSCDWPQQVCSSSSGCGCCTDNIQQRLTAGWGGGTPDQGLCCAVVCCAADV